MKAKTPLARNAFLKTLAAQFVLFLLLTLPAAVQAQDYSYTTTNGQVTITRYTGPAGDVTIPSMIGGQPVTGIGSRAFIGRGVISISIPSSVTNVAGGAFADSSSLRSITVASLNPSYASADGVLFNKNQSELLQYPPARTGNAYVIPSGTVLIGYRAFYSSQHLTDVTIPDSVEIIERSAFFQCYYLATIMIPSRVSSIGIWAFESCPNLRAIDVDQLNATYRSVDGVLFDRIQASLIRYPEAKATISYTIPDATTRIGNGAFNSCKIVTNITIGDGVTSIGVSAFGGCSGLLSVSISKSVNSIEEDPFSGCNSLTRINVDKSNTAYHDEDGVLFDKAKTTLIRFPEGKAANNYVVPDGIERIGDWAFGFCTGLLGITIPDSVTSIGNGAFAWCSGLTRAIIGDNVIRLGGDAFRSCLALTSVIVGNGVASIGDYTFDGCENLVSVTIGDGVTNIGASAFQWCKSLPKVTLGSSVTNIGDRAFYYCYALAEVKIPKSLGQIGYESFAACTSLRAVYFEGDAPTGDSSVFSDSNQTTVYRSVAALGWTSSYGGRPTTFWDPQSQLLYASNNGQVTVTGRADFEPEAMIPSTINGLPVTSIGSRAFAGMGMVGITIPNSVTSINVSAFAGCFSLTAITVEPNNSAYSSVAGILFNKSQTTLLRCPQGKVGNYKIPNTVTLVDVAAFTECTGLTSVTIGHSVISIGDVAFAGCSSLTSIEIPDNVTTMGAAAFASCLGLTNVTIGDGITAIGGETFESCSGLINITIGNSVTRVGNTAFAGCMSLTGAFFQGNAPSIGFSVFAAANTATVYYLPGTTGWGQTLGDRPTAHWSLPNPLILGNGSTGVQNDRFGFTISWATNQPVVVEASTTLTNPTWAPISTNTLTGGSAYFSDPQWTEYPTRLYRVRSP